MTNLSQLKQICGRSEFWPRLYPRMYKHADAWGDVGFAAGTLTLAVEGECRTEPPERAIFSRIASLLERQNVPTQFLSREFANAVRRSEPHGDIEWAAIKFPFDAAVLMLPQNWLVHPDAGNIEFIGYARLRADDPVVPMGYDIPTAFDDDGFVVWTVLNDDAMSSLVEMMKRSDKPRIGDCISTPEERFFSEPVNVYDQYIPSAEFDLLDLMVKLVFSVILAETARPSLISRGQRSGRHQKTNLPIWTPNVIGRDYRVLTDKHTDGETYHAGKRMHWRRGHFRSQPFGERNAERRIQWIEPMLISGENKQQHKSGENKQ